MFRSYIDLALRSIAIEDANTLSVPARFFKCLNIEEFGEKCNEVRPDIWRKGIFDAACDAVKNVSFTAYNDIANNPVKKAELLKHLKKVRSLAR
jgi:hypothetical protein